jgi:hypothetical protein
MVLYSIRLDEASEQALIAAARSRKVTRAVILREALAEYGKGAGRAVSPAPQFASLIGVIENGPGNLSERTGERFAGIGKAVVGSKSAARSKPAIRSPWLPRRSRAGSDERPIDPRRCRAACSAGRPHRRSSRSLSKGA